MSDLVGRTISHYGVIRELGKGGMGDVYLAQDRGALDRTVALKVLPTSTMADETARARLLREARLASSLNHPNIAHIYEVGEDGGRDFIAMELVEGRTLSDATPSDGFPTETLFRYAIQIADALAYAHEHGVIHRDLKNSNIMVTDEGRVKILDFGLAKRTLEIVDEHTPPDLGITRPGVVMGTPTHLPPEVLGGAAADARSDVWAFGVVLYEMACGRFPFRGSSLSELATAIRRDPPTPLGESVNPGIQSVILRCLAKEPGQRYQKAGEVRAALEAVQQATTRPGEQTPARTDARAVGSVVVWVAAAVVAAGITVYALMPHGDQTTSGGAPRIAATPLPPPPGLRAEATPPAGAPLTPRTALVKITRDGAEQPLGPDDVVRPGDQVALQYSCKDSSYVYVCDLDDQGHLYPLFPRADVSLRNPLAAGANLRLPGARDGQPLAWPVKSASGGERIYVVASRTRLDGLESALAHVATAAAPPPGPRMRGIEGVAVAPTPRAPSTAHVRKMLSELAQRYAENQPDLWVWQQKLRSLPRGATD